MHQAVPVLAAFAILYLFTRQFFSKRRRWILAKQFCCEDPPSYPILDLFGIREMFRSIASRKSNLLLEKMTERFVVVSEQEGRHVMTFTFQMPLSKTKVMTSDSRNMQAAYAKQFKDLELHRMCIGQQLALKNAGYVIVRLLQRFDSLNSSAVDDGPVRVFATTGIAPLHGVHLRLHEAEE